MFPDFAKNPRPLAAVAMALAHSRRGATNLGDPPRHPLAQTANGDVTDALEQDVEEWIDKLGESPQLEARRVADAGTAGSRHEGDLVDRAQGVVASDQDEARGARSGPLCNSS
jgi:hypothetical protein